MKVLGLPDTIMQAPSLKLSFRHIRKIDNLEGFRYGPSQIESGALDLRSIIYTIYHKNLFPFFANNLLIINPSLRRIVSLFLCVQQQVADEAVPGQQQHHQDRAHRLPRAPHVAGSVLQPDRED